ncbi:abortive infection family protein [Ligilactobacillus equi]
MMSDNLFNLIVQRELISVLDGDTDFGLIEVDDTSIFFDKRKINIQLPKLSGPKICEIGKLYGFPMNYDGEHTRYQYMYNLLKYGIQNSKIQTVLSYFFSDTNFEGYEILNGISNDQFNDFCKEARNSALRKINGLLSIGNYKLDFNGKTIQIISTKESIDVSVPQIKIVGQERIRELMQRGEKNIETGDYDSTLTQARTILEETFRYILERKSITLKENLGINELYKEVKKNYNMIQKNINDKRVKKLLSGLETIVQSVSELRNKESDSHGQGSRRLGIKDYHARLVLNSAVTMSEFLLSVSDNALNI